MTRALVTKMLRALDASRDDVNECLNEVLPKAGSYRYDRVIDSLTAKLAKHDAAITAARKYLATEPSGERAELIAKLRDAHGRRFVISPSPYSRAADMLEADAQQAKQVPLSDVEIYVTSKRFKATFELVPSREVIAFARAIEAHHGVTNEQK